MALSERDGALAEDPTRTAPMPDAMGGATPICDLDLFRKDLPNLPYLESFGDWGGERGLLDGGTCRNVPQTSGTSVTRRPTIDPYRYGPIPEGARDGPCPYCRRRKVHYHIRRHGRSTEAAGAMATSICQDCYEAARRREQIAIQTLPGVLPVGELVRINPARHGRCDVCHLGTATYRHVASATVLCNVCYAKQVRDQVEVR